MGSFNRRQEADDLTDYVNNGWLSSAEFDGPTFLWNHLIREASQEDAAQRNDVNFLGSYSGAIAQSPADAGAHEMLPGDLATARLLGERVAALAAQFKG